MSTFSPWKKIPDPDLGGLQASDEVPEWLLPLVASRGVSDAHSLRRFLNPELEHLHDAADLPDASRVLSRLTTAREQGEKVAIVGDYDVDGISATAIFAATFAACGLEVKTILPNRLEEGYGFQPNHVKRAQEAGCSLIITADCGSSSFEAVEAAAAAGLDVVVTDHHQTTGAFPREVMEVNPQLPNSVYPFSDLSGAGVAFKLAAAFAEMCGKTHFVTALLRIACLGTIADMVPLVGENRVIAALGLKALADTRSLGLRALMNVARVARPLDASDVGFRIGPRLNAPGRLGSPEPALDLLLSRDPKEAARLAAELDRSNSERRTIQDRVASEATDLFDRMSPLPPILMAWSKDWHRGVVGIAASKIAREFQRPALLLSVDGDQAVGSGRSVPNIHLHRFLSRWTGRLARFGGHSQAVGLTASVAELEHLREEWCSAALAEWPSETFEPVQEYELDLAVQDIDETRLAAIESLGPFGAGNRRPLARVGPMELSGEPRTFGRSREHLFASVNGPDGSKTYLLGWRWSEHRATLDGVFEVLGNLQMDTYRNEVVLEIVAARPHESS